MASLLARLRDLWRGFFDAFVRDNKVLPPVVALLALFLFAWVVAGAFVNEPDNANVSGEADLVQSRNPADAAPVAPEAEDRDADSFAAYRNKDPFRQLLAQAEEPADDTSDDASGDTSDDEAASPPPSSASPAPSADDSDETGNGNDGGGNGGGGATSRADSDGDGVPTRREERLGLDPRNPDTDSDGQDDGVDRDADGDGVPDRRESGNEGGSGGGAGGGDGDDGSGGSGDGFGGSGGGGGGGSGGGSGSSDELFDSGGTLAPR